MQQPQILIKIQTYATECERANSSQLSSVQHRKKEGKHQTLIKIASAIRMFGHMTAVVKAFKIHINKI